MLLFGWVLAWLGWEELLDALDLVIVAWALRVDVHWSVDVAELMSIKEGLQLVSKLGLSIGFIKCDASTVVREINGAYPLSPLTFTSVVSVVRELIHLVGGGSYCVFLRSRLGL